MRREKFLNKIKEYQQDIIHNDDIHLYLAREEEINTGQNIIDETKVIHYIKNNNEWLKKQQSFFKQFDIDLTPEQIKKVNYKVKIDYDALEVEDKEIYDIYCNPNQVFDILNDSKKTITILRLEKNNSDEGIYQSGVGLNIAINKKGTDPRKDEMINTVFAKNPYNLYLSDTDYEKQWSFAFKNMKQLLEWFPKETHQKLTEKDIVIKEYEVDENAVIEGNGQLIFKKENAKLKNVLNIIDIDFIESNDLYDFLDNKNNLLNMNFIKDRDYFIARNGNNIIGAAILANNDKKSSLRYMQNVITLSNIEVAQNYKNTGIATRLLQSVMLKVKSENKILKRTDPEPEGFDYIYDKFTRMLNKNNIMYIPHNLAFIYETLENYNQFKNKNNQQRITLMYQYEKKLKNSKTFQESGMKEVSSSLYQELESILKKKMTKTIKNNKF